jgi:hypothetical protein
LVLPFFFFLRWFMTELQALNTVLQAIQQLPVTNYDSPHPDAVGARVVLENLLDQVQSRGWWFNQDKDFEMVPEHTGKILVPQNTLAVYPQSRAGNNDRYDITQRGSYLYDMQKNTFILNRPVRADLVHRIPLNQCPSTVAVLIARAAAYEYALDKADQNTLSRLNDLMFQARSAAYSEDLRNKNVNAHRSPRAMRMIAGVRPFMRR